MGTGVLRMRHPDAGELHLTYETLRLPERDGQRILAYLPADAATETALAGLAVASAIGLVCVGTLFSAMATHTRLAELLLPMLALPFFVPVVMPAAQVNARLLQGRPIEEAWVWLRILLAFDLVFLVACTLAFPYVVED